MKDLNGGAGAATQTSFAAGDAIANDGLSEPVSTDTGIAVLDAEGDGWPADLTRRLRVLLHTVPLDGMRRGDAIRDAGKITPPLRPRASVTRFHGET